MMYVKSPTSNVLMFVLAATVIAAGFFNIALAQPAYTINYQGKLTTPTGVAVADGTYTMEFKLYTVSSGGVAVWTETRNGGNQVTVQNGLFSVMLGSVTSLSSVNFNQPLYLGVKIATDNEMTPRKAIGTVPSAFEAKQLGGVASSSFLRSDAADTAASLLTFNGGLISNSSSTIARLTIQTATTTNLVINSERFTDLTGTGLLNSAGSLTLDNTGAWTGTFDGQQGSYYLANSFSTTSATYFEGTQTSRLADDLTNNSLEDLQDVASITKNPGDLLGWNGSAWTDFATSSLNIALANTTGTLGVTRGGTGLTAASTGDILYASGANTLARRSIGTTGQVLQVVGGLPTWVATSSLGITGGGGGTYLSLTDTPNAYNAFRIPYTNSGASALTDASDFLFNDSTDRLTVGTATFGTTGMSFAGASTTTVPNNNPYAFTIATSTTARPLFRIDTTSGAESVELGTVGGDVFIGGIGAPSNLVFEESSTISGQGTNVITLGVSGDIFNVASGTRFGVATSSPWQEFSVNGDFALTGRFYDSLASAGTNGRILQTTGTGVQWVATSSLGIAVSEATVEAYIFDGDNSGTLSSGTLALDSLSYSGTLDDTNINDAISLIGGVIGSNSIAEASTWTTLGTLTIGDGGDQINISSNTWDVTNGAITNVTSYNGLVVTANTGVVTTGTWQAGVIASAYLDTTVILSSEIDTSSELRTIITDETGNGGSIVFASEPVFTDTGGVGGGTITLGASGMTLATDGDGAISFFALGDGADENLTLNLDDTANTGVFTSGSGLNVINFSGIALQESGSAVLSVGDLDTCAEFASLGTVETGTCGSLVLSVSPTITGTLDVEASDFSGTLTLSGTAANIALGSNWLSGDGADEGIFVNSIGSVGIGTSSPTAILSVAQDASDTSPMFVVGNKNTSGYTIAQFNRSAVQRSAQLNFATAGVNDWQIGTLYNGGGSNSGFSIQASATLASISSTVPAFHITTAGNVGIGIIAPASGTRLDVYGRIKAGTGVASPNESLLVNTPSGTSAGLQLFQDGVESWVIANPAASSRLAFSASGAERMTITSAGNVGIGTTSPASYSYNTNAQLVVSGAAHSNITVVSGNTSTGGLAFADGTAGTAKYSGLIQYDHNANIMDFYTGGVYRAGIGSTGVLNLTAGLTVNSETVTDFTGAGLTLSSGALTVSLGNNSITPNNILTTGQTDEFCLTYEGTGTTFEWQTCGAAGLASTDIDTSSELAAILTDETGTGAAVFAGSPTFTGTISAAASTFSGGISISGNSVTGAGLRLTDEGAYKQIQSYESEPLYINPLGNNTIFNTGGGSVGIGTTNPSGKFNVNDGTNRNFLVISDATQQGTNGVAIGSFNDGASGYMPLSIVSSKTIFNSSVGIGTTSPQSAFSVVSASANDNTGTFFYGSGSAAVRILGNSASQQNLYFGSGSNQTAGSVTYVNSSNAMFFSTNSGERMRITSAGNVGIGTTTPSKKLVVSGAHAGSEIQLYSIGDSASDNAILNFWASEPNITYTGVGIGNNIRNWNGSVAFARENTTNGGSYMRLLENAFVFNTVDSSGVDTRAMTIVGGNVGIGTTTPNQKLDIWGNLKVNTGSYVYLNSQQNVSLGADSNSLYQTAVGAIYSNVNGAYRSVLTENGLSINNGSGGPGSGVGLYVATGNVGIGDATPSYKLEVAGDIRGEDIYAVRTGAPTTGVIYFGNNSGTRYLYYNGSAYALNGAELSINGGTAWHSANDGAGSGLDADLLDGISSASFLQGFSIDTSAELSSILTDETGTGAAVFAGSPTLTGTVNAAALSLSGLLSQSSAGILVGTKDDISTRTESGFYESSTGTTAEGWPVNDSSWQHLIASTHSNAGNYYSLQIAGSFFDQNLYFRKTNASGVTAWSKVISQTDIDTSAELLTILNDETGTGAAVFATSPTLADTLTITGSRPVTFSGGAGSAYIQGDAGGWATVYGFKGSSGTNRGGFGALGGTDALAEYWIGPDYTTAYMTLENSGEVGIGTVDPLARLHVAGGNLLLDNNRVIQQVDHLGTIRNLITTATDSSVFYNGYQGTNIINAVNGATYLSASGGGSTVMTLTTTGSVGIGITGPAGLLHVQGTVAGGRTENLVLGNTGSTDNSSTAIYMGYQDAGLGLYGARILQRGNPSGTRSSDLLFQIHNGTASNADAAWDTPLMIQRTTGNVGIGTTNPLQKLVASNGGNEGVEFVPGAGSGSSIVQAYNRGDSSYDVLYYDALAHIYRIGTSEYMRVDSNGNVGIGDASPEARLQVSPAAAYTAINSGQAFVIRNTGLTGANLAMGVSGAYGNVIQSRDGATTGYGLRINPYGGNVGIGGGDTTPGRQLTVGGTTNAYSSYAASSGRTYTVGTDSNGYIIYDDTAGLYRMVINSSGNVGIGDTSPDQKLSVTDTLAITNSGGAQFLLMGNQDSAGVNNPSMIVAANGNLDFGNGTSWTGSGGTFASRLMILDNGNVGVGTQNPNGRFEVTTNGGGDGVVFYQGVDNSSSIQSYIDAQWSNRASYAAGCCNTLNINTDAGDIVMGSSGRTVTVNSNTTFNSSITATGNITAGTAVYSSGTGGFYSSTFASNVRNPIWRFANADAFGVSYFQGTSGYTGGAVDTIGFHMGTASAAASILTINQDNTVGVNGDLRVTGAIKASDPSYNTRRYINVGQFAINGANQTGTIKIAMPAAKRNSDTMHIIKITGYDYVSGQGAWEVLIGGYTYSSGWINTSVDITGSPPFTSVRLGDDGVSDVILLGTTGTVWQYPQIFIDNYAGYSAQEGFDAAWTTSLITSESGITVENTPYIKTFAAAGGNFGIGTSVPGSLLDVRGSTPIITVGTTGNAEGALFFGNSAHGVRRNYSGTNDVGLYTTSGDVYLGSSGQATSQFVLKNSGFVGIGDATPDKLFDVEGSAVFGAGGVNSGSVVDIGSTATDYPATSGWGGSFNANLTLHGQDTTSIGFHDGGISVGALSYTNNSFAFDGAGSWGPASLGINDRTPDYMLDVAGSIGADGDLTFTNGRKGMVGQYDAAQTQAIFAMGNGYQLTSGGASNVYGAFYGIGWSYNPDYGGAGNNPQSKAGLNHQLLVMNNGVTQSAIGSGIWTQGMVTVATGNYLRLMRSDNAIYNEIYYGSGDKFQFNQANNGSYNFAFAGTDQLTIGNTGNFVFTAANPSITASSYVVMSGGAYFSSGTVYAEAAIQARGGINNDTGAYLNISGGTSNIIYMDSDTGIGRTDPQKRLEVFETVADAQFRVSYDASNYADFRTNSGGDLTIDASGGDVSLLDENFYVCSGGSCASTPNGAGTITSERAITAEEGSLGTTGSLTVNWDDGNQQRVNSSTGNMTFTFSNATAGQTLRLVVCYGGAHTVTWGSTIRWAGGTAPTPTSANTKCDVFSFLYTGTEYLGQPSLNF